MEVNESSAYSIFNKVNIKDIHPIIHISYWQYTALQECKLKGLFPRYIDVHPVFNDPSNQSRRVILGKVFHKIMEDISNETKQNGKPVPDRIKELCSNAFFNIQETLISKGGGARFQNIKSWPEAGLVYKAVGILNEKIAHSNNKKQSDIQVLTEYWLESSNGKVVGQPDVIIRKDDFIELIDYKFGIIEQLTNDQMFKYINQLRLYANLIEDKFNIFPSKAILLGKDGSIKYVSLIRETSKEIRREMESLLVDVNRSIEKYAGQPEKLSSPSEEACGYCDAKPWCPSFRYSMSKFSIPKNKHILFGIQIDKLKESRRAGATLEIKSLYRSFKSDDEYITITRLNKSWFPDFQDRPGQALIISNVTGSDGCASVSCGFETQIMVVDNI